MKADELHVAVDQVRVNRLGEDVGRVLLPRPLQKGKVPRANALLHPHLGYCEVSDSADPGASANPNCRAALGANLKGSSKPK
eukprot:10926036-Alexandrium_andersonii.AAC.1